MKNGSIYSTCHEERLLAFLHMSMDLKTPEDAVDPQKNQASNMCCKLNYEKVFI